MNSRLILACWLLCLLGIRAEVETWENKEGKKMEAELVDVTEKEAVFKMKKSGKQLSYPIAKLAEESQKRVAAFKKEQESKKEEPDEKEMPAEKKEEPAPEDGPDEKGAPAGVDPALTSKDKDYGFDPEKPVLVGSKEDGGEKATAAYFDSLVDAKGKKVKAKMSQTLGETEDGHILYVYQVTHSGGSTSVYIDMEHPERDPLKALAPQGFWKKKK